MKTKIKIITGIALILISVFILLFVYFYDKNFTEINPFDKCKLKPEAGPCKALFTRYYFDQQERICKGFTWGGCQGVVPFETLGQCKSVCE